MKQPVRVGGSGQAYSSDFLDQIKEDLRQLAIDYERAGGTVDGAKKLLEAADLVRKIQNHNEE